MKSCCTATRPDTSGRRASRTTLTFALIGQPNCGKTTLFNRLTGTHQTTGNWPGVTVERKEGRVTLPDGTRARLIDLPGVYSLLQDAHSGEDEAIARNFLTCQPVDAVINVMDATALERQLFLTLQLRHMGLPLVVALNRIDLLGSRHLHIDTERLAQLLDCPVMPISAYHGKGIDSLLKSLQSPLSSCPMALPMPEALAEAVQTLQTAAAAPISEWQAFQYLLDPAQAPDTLVQPAAHLRKQVEAALEEDIRLIIADVYFAAAHDIARQVVRRTDRLTRSMTDRIDRWVLHRFWGMPIFFLIMYLVFSLSINLGNGFVDAFDQTAQALFVDGLRTLLAALHLPDWLITLLADGVGGGIQVVASFIPVLAFLFLFLSLLEESGYMQRAALLMDRAFQKLGLSGHAFVPLVVGFGCNVPAVMAARTLPDQRDRIMTVLMTPFMSCSARLTVYALFGTVFFSQHAALLIFLLYLIGIGAAVLTAWLLKQTLLPGEHRPLLLELPAYHRPSLRNLLLNAHTKLKGFMLDAGKIIIAVVLVLNVLNSIGTDGTFGRQDQPDSVLSELGRSLTPLVEPLGVEPDNWPATVGLFTGLLAKEVVVGTLDALYRNMDGPAFDEPESDASFDLWRSLSAAWATVPAYFAEFGQALLDPLGLSMLNETDHEALGVSATTVSKLAEHFHDPIGVFAYLLLVLLYFPCVATFAAIRQELGWRWALFSGGWSLMLGYSAAVGFYQAATLPTHPVSSMLWLTGIGMAWLLLFLLLKRTGRGHAHSA